MISHYRLTPDEQLYEILNSPDLKSAYYVSEGNVESNFCRILLEVFANIHVSWINYQTRLFDDSRPDILIRLNGKTVFIIECKRPGVLNTFRKKEKAFSQVLEYAEKENCKESMIIDTEKIFYFSNDNPADYETIANDIFSTADEIFERRNIIKQILSPRRLYNISCDLGFIERNVQLQKTHKYVKRGKINNYSDIKEHLNSIIKNQNERNIYSNVIENWNSFHSHLSISGSLNYLKTKDNTVVHIDYSFINFFQQSWFYDELHLAVREGEEFLTRNNPGFALRAFVYNDKKDFSNNTLMVNDLVISLLSSGYRVAFINRKHWLKNGMHDGHIDIVSNEYAKIYTESNVLIGKEIRNSQSIEILRKSVEEVVRLVGKIFEPATPENSSIIDFLKWRNS